MDKPIYILEPVPGRWPWRWALVWVLLALSLGAAAWVMGGGSG